MIIKFIIIILLIVICMIILYLSLNDVSAPFLKESRTAAINCRGEFIRRAWKRSTRLYHIINSNKYKSHNR